MEHGVQYRPPFVDFPLTHTAHGFAPGTSVQEMDGNRQTALHDAPRIYLESRARPVNAAPDFQIDAASRRADRARRRLLNAQMYGTAHSAGQSLLEPPQDSSGSNVPPAPSAPRGRDYYYPAYFQQPTAGEHQSHPSGINRTFAQAFEQPFFRNAQRPAWATSSSTGMPASSSGVPSDPRHHADGPASGPQPASFSTYEGANPFRRSMPLNASGQAMDSDMVLELAYQHGNQDALRQMYEAMSNPDFVGRPQSHGDPNSATDRSGTQDNTASTMARRQELLERRSRELQLLRVRARRAVARPPPAQVQQFTTLLAADTSHDVECPICQEPYDDDEHPAIQLKNVACTHIFGRGCLQEWCNSGMENAHKCPSCRQSLDGALDIPSLRRRRSSDVIMPPRPFASRRGHDPYISNDRVRAMDDSLARGGASQAQRDAFRQQMEGQILTPSLFNGAMVSPPPMSTAARAPARPSTLNREHSRSARDRATEALRRQMAFQRQQRSRFDADAARRITTAQASDFREAHALTTQIAEERAALISGQDQQLVIAHDRAMREAVMQRDGVPRQA